MSSTTVTPVAFSHSDIVSDQKTKESWPLKNIAYTIAAIFPINAMVGTLLTTYQLIRAGLYKIKKPKLDILAPACHTPASNGVTNRLDLPQEREKWSLDDCTKQVIKKAKQEAFQAQIKKCLLLAKKYFLMALPLWGSYLFLKEAYYQTTTIPKLPDLTQSPTGNSRKKNLYPDREMVATEHSIWETAPSNYHPAEYTSDLIKNRSFGSIACQTIEKMLLEQKNSRLQGFIMPPYTQKEIEGFKMSGDELRSCLKQLYQSYNKQFPEGATQVQWERFTRKHLNEWFYADEVHEPKHLFNLWHHQSDQKKDLPLNPIGPTGLRGLGCLPHWGANRCVYPMIEIKNQVTHENFWIVVENQIKDEWGFPEGDENDRLGTLRDMSLCEEILFKQVFKEGVLIKEALSSFSDEIYPLINAIRQPVVNQAPKQIYKGYVDDPRNTDNAWVDGMFLHWTIILTEQQIALLRKILERANEPERVKLAKIEEINYSIHGQIYLS